MSKKVMIIDDAVAIRQVVSLALSESGYDSIEASDGEDALKKLKASDVDLIICDVNMPKVDGIEFLRQIKNEKEYENLKFTPIIMLTTESGGDMKTQGKELGAKAWLVKPFKPDKLISAVEKLIA